MRLCRFDDDRLGVVEGELVLDVSAALELLPARRWPLPPGDLLIRHLEAITGRCRELKGNAERRSLATVTLKSPVANPGKIIAAPVNYQKHIDEARADAGIHFGSEVKAIDHYGLFLKANSSLVGPGEGIALPPVDRRVDQEVELAAIIGRDAYRVPRARALDHVAGDAIGLDKSIRGTEDRSWRKSFDGATVLGPWLVTADEIGEPGALDLEIRINGETRQASNTRHMIFDLPRLIEYASSTYHLHPGDIILTGTPDGVAPVQAGDVMVAEIEAIGRMTVAVRAALA
jgi:2-keto-4-pentenoate hydratase/2-oxohepta-3-ene-1,7-dioic acid hydratase in catechol pathway